MSLLGRGAVTAAMPAFTALAGTALLLVVGESMAPGFAAGGQLVAQLTVAAILGIAAIGQNLVILSGRDGIDLSLGSVMSLAALLAGNVMSGQDALVFPALAVALAAGFAVGLVNGIGVALLRIPSLVMTLGTAGVVAGTLVVLTRGQTSGSAAPLLVDLVARPLVLGVPGILLIWVLLAGVVTLVLRETRFGLDLYAVGSNDHAAALAGVPVRLTRTLAYAAGSMAAAGAGFLLLGYTGSIFVAAGEQYVLPSVIAVVIGGTSLAGGQGTYLGTIAGAVFLTFLTAFLTTLAIDPAQRQIIFGLIMIAFMGAYARGR